MAAVFPSGCSLICPWIMALCVAMTVYARETVFNEFVAAGMNIQTTALTLVHGYGFYTGWIMQQLGICSMDGMCYGMKQDIFLLMCMSAISMLGFLAWVLFQRLSPGPLVPRTWKIQHKKRHTSKTFRLHYQRSKQWKTVACIFLFILPTSHGMNQEQFTQLMTTLGNLAQGSTVAAQAAASVVTRLEQTSASSGSGISRNIETASKILRNPEVFDGADPNTWQAWRHGFINWLTYADSRFVDALSQVEHLPPGHTLDKTGWSETDREVNTKLYSILTSYLRGSPLQLSRLLGNEKDGLRLWQLLRDQYAPVTRSRQLALSQAISSFPCFDTNKALSASITELEQLVNEFEMLSGKRYAMCP